MAADPAGGAGAGRADGDGAADYERLLDRIAVLAQAFGGARDLPTVFRNLADFAAASTGCVGIFVSLYDAERQVRVPAYARSEGQEVDVSSLPPMPMSGSPHSLAVSTGRVIVEDDFEAAMAGKPIVHLGEDIDPRPVRSTLAAPMAVRGRVVGAIEVQSPERAAFTTEHATAVRMAANLAAVAIENVRLWDREREREAHLRQAQRMEAVGRLAGGVAHDFNNLLTVITGYGEMALRRMGEGDAARRDVEEIRRAADRAASLTRQLLAFGRRQVLQPRELDLNAEVEELTRMLTRLLGEDVHLVFSPQPGLGRVLVDKGQLEQVIVNLAVNARDAMPRGGWLRLETLDVELAERHLTGRDDLRPGAFVMLAISDTGGGIDEATLAHIFEPFFTTKEPGKGTGLGLATVYGIIRQSGGLIEVESRVGRGTTFRIFLPRVASGAPAPAAAGGEAGPAVLLALDDPEERAGAAAALRGSGYRVIEASDAEDALALAGLYAGDIALVVADADAGPAGRALAERMAARRPGLRVLSVTDSARGGAPGPFALGKPFGDGELARAVRSALDDA